MNLLHVQYAYEMPTRLATILGLFKIVMMNEDKRELNHSLCSRVHQIGKTYQRGGDDITGQKWQRREHRRTNVCQYNKKKLSTQTTASSTIDTCYEQMEWLEMGSPLSPILADICTDNFKNQIINGSKRKNNIKLWQRYMDEISLIWPGTDRQLNTFFTKINIKKDVQFAMEKEDKIINCLNLAIRIKNIKIHYNIIYGKSRQTL